MQQEKPKPEKWQDIVNDLDNSKQINEQNRIMIDAQLAAAKEQL